MHATLLIKVTGKTWNDTILSEFKVTRHGKTLYQYSQENLFYTNEEYFNTENFDSCSNFIDCKKKYYNNLLDATVVSSKKSNYSAYSPSDLKTVLLAKSEPIDNVDSFVDYLCTETYDQLFIPESLWKTWEILVYNKSLNKFVNISME